MIIKLGGGLECKYTFFSDMTLYEDLISIHIFLLLNSNYAANIHLLFLISNHSCLKVQAR